MKSKMKIFIAVTLLWASATSFGAVGLGVTIKALEQSQSFTGMGQGPSDLVTVKGAILRPGFEDEVFIFGNAKGGVTFPADVGAFTGMSANQSSGFLGILRKQIDDSWAITTAGNTELAMIVSAATNPINDLTDPSKLVLEDADIVTQVGGEDIWLCGTMEHSGPVTDLLVRGSSTQQYPWHLTGKSGFLMQWGQAAGGPLASQLLEQVAPSLMAPIGNRFLPHTIKGDASGGILIGGTDLAGRGCVCYRDNTGMYAWVWYPPDPATTISQVEVGDNGAPLLFVLAETPGLGTGKDVLVYQLDLAGGIVPNWNGLLLASDNDDYAGKMVWKNDQTLAVSLTTTGSFGSIMYNGTPSEIDSSLHIPSAELCQVLTLKETSGMVVPIWASPIGIGVDSPSDAEDDWKMRVSGMSSDLAGNLHLTLTTSGWYEIGCHVYDPVIGAGFVSVDGTGRVWNYREATDFPESTGGTTLGLCGQMVTGGTGNGTSFAVFSPAPVQDSYVVCALNPVDGDTAIKHLISTVTAVGGQVHLEMRHDRFDVYCVAAYLTPDQLAAINADPSVSVEPDPRVIERNGGSSSSQNDAGWALARLNSPSDSAASATSEYDFWENSGLDSLEKPRVYLLDTGSSTFDPTDSTINRFTTTSVKMSWSQYHLDHPIGANSEEGSYTIEHKPTHANEMTKLLALKPRGAGQGIPFDLRNINIYPDRGTDEDTTFLSYVTDGIFHAVDEVLDDKFLGFLDEDASSLILVPSSGQTTEALSSFVTFKRAVDEAIDARMPIVLSAGNVVAPVESSIPAAFGTRAGVITVGATERIRAGSHNRRWTGQCSDTSGTITLYAPGVLVNAGSGANFTGTSASCAFAAGVAAAIMSENLNMSAQEVESVMIANSIWQSTDSIRLLTLDSNIPVGCRFQAWLESYGIGNEGLDDDSDGDGLLNLAEYLADTDPTSGSSNDRLSFSMKSTGSGTTWEHRIDLPSDVIQGSAPFNFLDFGCGLEVQVALEWSSDLLTWSPVLETPAGSGTWHLGTPDITRQMTPLLFTVPVLPSADKRFWRFSMQASEEP